MKEFSILICDLDLAYVNALSNFLGSRKRRISVSAFTQIDAFKNHKGFYDLALMGKEYLEVYEKERPDIHIEKIMILSATAGEQEITYEVFYKFQNMSKLSDIISKLRNENKDGGLSLTQPGFLGVFSPNYHDLRLPFSMTLAHVLSLRKKTLFLDLEAFSPLPDLISNENFEKDFMDIIYLMESQGEDFHLEQHLFFYEEIALLPVIKNPEDLFHVSESMWLRFYELVDDMGYSLVLLFDQFFPGMEAMYAYMDELVLLGRCEDFYQYSYEHCEKYMLQMDRPPKLHGVKLNMTAANLADGTYRLKNLMEGNLKSFVWNEFKGTFALSNS